MFFYIVSVSFFCVLLANKLTTTSSEFNPYPCMYSAETDAYKTFLNKHVRPDAPETLDQNQWQAFIKNIGTCDRPIQSFIPFAQKQQVDNVCSLEVKYTLVTSVSANRSSPSLPYSWTTTVSYTMSSKRRSIFYWRVMRSRVTVVQCIFNAIKIMLDQTISQTVKIHILRTRHSLHMLISAF